MIASKKDFYYYLECDKVALQQTHQKPRYKHDIIWTFQILLRRCEYISNCKSGMFWMLYAKLLKFRFVVLSHRLGLSIPFNVFGPGVAIVHYGCTVVSHRSKIGNNCRIHEGVTIGTNAFSDKAPQIGKNVYIASGAKIIGDITIADGVCIGANALVVKDILEPNITVSGIPARKISDNNSDKFLVKATEIVKSNE
jgi:serine O-acetyltransferase